MIPDPRDSSVSIYAWSNWGECSATCGKSTRSRHLVCEPEGLPTSSAVLGVFFKTYEPISTFRTVHFGLSSLVSLLWFLWTVQFDPRPSTLDWTPDWWLVFETKKDLQKSEARDWVNLDENNVDFLSQMMLGQGNCIPQWSEWTERISGEDKVRHIMERVDFILIEQNFEFQAVALDIMSNFDTGVSNITTKLKTVPTNQNVQFTANGSHGLNAVAHAVKAFVPDKLVLLITI